jgi:hypothetical protein
MRARRFALLGAGLAIAGLLAIGVAYAAPSSNGSSWIVNDPGTRGGGPGRMAGYGMMGVGYGYGMMDGAWNASSSGPAPGEVGFVAGTESAPRVVQIYAYPNDRFVPDTVTVQGGETVSFQVTTLGPRPTSSWSARPRTSPPRPGGRRRSFDPRHRSRLPGT